MLLKKCAGKSSLMAGLPYFTPAMPNLPPSNALNSAPAWPSECWCCLPFCLCNAIQATMVIWKDFEPSLTSSGTICSNLKACLYPGTFVRVNTSKLDDYDGTSPTVCRILKVNDEDITLNVFDNVEDNEVDGIEPLSEASFRYVSEVVQTNQTINVESKDIDEIAFVMKLCDLEGSHTFQAMTNVAVLRYHYDGTAVSSSHCRPFPTSYSSFPLSDCYASTVWRDLNSIRDGVSSILQTERMRQGNSGCKGYGKAEM